MLIRGLWTLCDDGVVRPLIEGEVLAADGSWLPTELLVDVGADRTVFTAAVLAVLGLPQLPVTRAEREELDSKHRVAPRAQSSELAGGSLDVRGTLDLGGRGELKATAFHVR